MTQYEYRVLPAPEKAKKAKGVKGPTARFAHAVEEFMNELGAEGWEYLRADTLPCVERSGLTKTVTEWRTLLVFRRPRLDTAEAYAPKQLAAPGPDGAEGVAEPAFVHRPNGLEAKAPDLDALRAESAHSLAREGEGGGDAADGVDGDAKREAEAEAATTGEDTPRA